MEYEPFICNIYLMEYLKKFELIILGFDQVNQ